MRYLVEPTAVTELREGGIIYSPYNTFRVKKSTRSLIATSSSTTPR